MLAGLPNVRDKDDGTIRASKMSFLLLVAIGHRCARELGVIGKAKGV